MVVLNQRGVAAGGGGRRRGRVLTRRRAPQDGCTPLHAAAARGHLAVVQVLVDAGADTDAKNVVSQRRGCWARKWSFFLSCIW